MTILVGATTQRVAYWFDKWKYEANFYTHMSRIPPFWLHTTLKSWLARQP